MRFFTVVDALKGYHQVLLDDESAAMTKFFTPFGCYMYRHLPFGICHAGDDHSRRVSTVFDDLPNCRRIVKDILIFSETSRYSSTPPIIRSLSTPTRQNFPSRHVILGGFVLNSTGFSPNPEILSSVNNSEPPPPPNNSEMRAFHGLFQQMRNVSNNLAAAYSPLFTLLKKNLQ